jgi:hypothetical protein
MAITREILHEDDEKILWREFDASIAYEGFSTEYKSGARYNEIQLQAKLLNALDVFENNFINWPNMTTVQKDAASRQAQRAVAAIIRILLQKPDTPGV